jgi:hypothetical protein
MQNTARTKRFHFTTGSAFLPTRRKRRQADFGELSRAGKPDLHSMLRFRITHNSPLITLILPHPFALPLEGVPASFQPGLRTVSRAQHRGERRK